MNILIKSLLKELRNPDEHKFQSAFDNFKIEVKKIKVESEIERILNAVKETTIKLKGYVSMGNKTPGSHPLSFLVTKAVDWPEIEEEVKTPDDAFRELIEKIDFANDDRCNQIIDFCNSYFESISNNNVTNTNNKKLPTNATLKEVVRVLHELKANNQGFTNEDLTHFVMNNFQVKKMAIGTVRKYVNNPNLLKK